MFEQFFNLLSLVSKDKDGYHKDYDFTVQYAKKLKAIVTGDVEVLLDQFDLRQSSVEWENQKKLTRSLAPAISSRITNPYKKALRIDGVKSIIEPEERSEEILEGFDGSLSIDEYIKQKIYTLQICDPNAWVVIDFNEFDYIQETAKPNPHIYQSKDVLDFKYDLGELVYLITQEEDGFNLWMAEKGVKLRQIESKNLGGRLAVDFIKIKKAYENEESLDVLPEVVKIGGSYFEVEEFEPKLDKVGARRVGYELDVRTEFRTVKSLIDSAIPRIEKIINGDSQLDMAVAMHLFPQKIISTRPCPGGAEGKCSNGYVHTGSGESSERKVCGKCNGESFIPLHTSTQDVIMINNSLESKDDQIDLDNVAKYLQVPTDVVKFQFELINFHVNECFNDVFTHTPYSTEGSEKTATQSGIDYEALNDVLDPFTQNISGIREFLVDIVSQLREIPLNENRFVYPADLNLQSLNDLLQEFKNSENSPEIVRVDLLKKISRKINHQAHSEHLKFMVMLAHDPWAGKSKADQKYLISEGLCTDYDKVFFATKNQIFNELERETENFFLLPFESRQEKIDAKVEERSKEIFKEITPLVPVE